MDLSNTPQIIMTTAKDFQKWSGEFMLETMKSTGAKQAVDKITAPIWAWGQRNAIYPLEFGIACCSLEFAAAYGPRWDMERLGMIPRSSPRQADVLLIMGWLSTKLRPSLRRLYEQMPEPKWVVAMGECAISGGPWYDGYNVIQGLDTIVPVDIYIPGCPPRPEALIDGMLKLNRKITAEQKGTFLD